MPLSALALALTAAFIHAGWNLLLARSRETEATTAVLLLVAVTVFAPVAALTWRVEPAAWKYIAASTSVQMVYYVALVAAYRNAEFTLVYPLARGVAPVLVLLISVAFLDAKTSLGQAAAVCLVGAGVVLVRGLRREPNLVGVLFALGVAVTIALYTLIDQHGIRHAAAIPYLELTQLAPAFLYGAWVWRSRGPEALRRQLTPASFAAGILMFVAYTLVLAALRLAPAAAVSAARETSVVIATALGALVLKERVGPDRMLGAILVAAGVALLGFT
jgi:drug/metabolite transporter (DMT)-like permease